MSRGHSRSTRQRFEQQQLTLKGSWDLQERMENYPLHLCLVSMGTAVCLRDAAHVQSYQRKQQQSKFETDMKKAFKVSHVSAAVVEKLAGAQSTQFH